MALFNVLVDIAAKTANFEAGMKRVEDRLDKLGGLVGKIGKITLAGVSIDGVYEFTKGAIEAATAAGDAADRVGILASDFSRLQFAAKQSSVDVQTLEPSLRSLQKQISLAAAGNKDVAASFAEIGLSARDLKSLSIDKQVETIADAFRSIVDPADRTRIATELFGKAGAELIPLLDKGSAGIRKLAEEADKLHITLDDRATKSIDRASKALDKFWSSAKGRTSNTVGTFLAEVFGSGDDLLDVENQLNQLYDSRKKLEEAKTQGGNVDKLLAATNSDIAALERQKDALAGVSAGLQQAGQLQAYMTQVNVDAAKSVDDVARANVALGEKLNQSGVDEYIERERLAAERYIATLQEAERQRQYFLKQIAVTDEMASQVPEAFQQTMDQAKQSNDEAIKGLFKVSEESERAAQSMQYAFENFFFDPFHDGLKGLAMDFLNTMRRLFAEQATKALFSRIGGTEGLGGFIQGLFGGGKAEGGPLEQGKWYIAGERGPEPIWGGGPGAFAMGYPRGGGGGGGGNVHIAPVYNIDARGATADVAQALPAILKKNSEQTVQMAVARVAQLVKAGAFR